MPAPFDHGRVEEIEALNRRDAALGRPVFVGMPDIGKGGPLRGDALRSFVEKELGGRKLREPLVFVNFNLGNRRQFFGAFELRALPGCDGGSSAGPTPSSGSSASSGSQSSATDEERDPAGALLCDFARRSGEGFEFSTPIPKLEGGKLADFARKYDLDAGWDVAVAVEWGQDPDRLGFIELYRKPSRFMDKVLLAMLPLLDVKADVHFVVKTKGRRGAASSKATIGGARLDFSGK